MRLKHWELGVLNLKNSVAIAAVTVFLLFSPARLRADETFGVGAHGGASFSNQIFSNGFGISGVTAPTNNMRTGFFGGAYLRLPVFFFLSLQPELNYVQRGFVGASAGVGLFTTQLDYVELPVLLRAEVDLGPVQPYAVAGPSFALAVNRAISGSAIGTVANGDISSLVREFELGLYFGAGLEFPLGDVLALSIEGRYYRGLTDTSVSGLGEYNTGFLALAALDIGF